jgi:Helix-turn-helix
MKIKSVQANNHRKCFEIDTAKGRLAFPYSKAELVPTAKNKVVRVFVDKELGGEWITYRVESGKESSIPLDAFLDYNRDPDYLTRMLLHRLTIDALDKVKEAKLSRRELARKLQTSPAQLYRLLDSANYSKTMDQMIKLLAVLGYEIDYKIVREKKKAA